TLVVAPDHQARQAINQRIHQALQAGGVVDAEEHAVRVLIARQDVTGADRQWAAQYARGDLVRYTKGSQVLGLAAGTYARVEAVHAADNLVTVRSLSGKTVTYDPRRLQGVTLYRETERAFARGDRVQVTAPDRERGVANRELGTIQHIDTNGRMDVRWDSGRTSSFDAIEYRHLDYGYAVTSHSSPG